MASGRETRAQIDTESVKGLLFMNGGGAVALLAFLPHVITRPDLKPLTVAVLCAMFTYQLGLVSAIVHNRLRRKCSLAYELAESTSPRSSPYPCKSRLIAWVSPGEPCVCSVSVAFHWASLGAFVVAGLTVLVGGLWVL